MTNKKKLFFAIPLLLLVVSCGKNKTVEPNKDNVENQVNPTGYVASYPDPVTGALHNAGMGWIALEEQTELGKLDLGASGDLPEVDCIGIQTCWDKLEPVEGEFYWDLIDQTIDYWTARGKRINFRICTDSLSLPEVFYGAPKWLNEKPYNVGYEEYVYSGEMMARVNDLADPTYQRYFERFMSKLAERYANNPYLDTIDIRGYGMYSEWHSGHSFATMEERMFTLAYIVDKYAEAFAKEGKSLFLSNSWDYQGGNRDGSSASTYGNCAYEDYLAWSAFDSAMHVEYVSYRRDGLAGNGVTKYSTDEKALYEIIRSGKKVGNGAEFFGGFDNFANSLYGLDPIEAVNELMFKSHCNYSTVMGWVNSEVARIVNSGYASLFNRGNQKMGYRLKVDECDYPRGVKQGNVAHIKTKISNSGVGRFILNNHNIQLMLIDKNNHIVQRYNDEDYDLRILLNGETLNVYSDVRIDSSLADGQYTLAIAIVDANGNPSVRLGQVGNYDDKIYPLGKMDIGNYEQLKPFYDEVDYSKALSYKFDANSNYEITFDYQPSVKLADFKFGDEDGFNVTLSGKKKDKIVACNFQDVSEEKAIKTVNVITGNDNPYTLSIKGSGIYENKINVSKVIIEKKTGYIENFENNYDLMSTTSPWYSLDQETAEMSDEYDALHGDCSVIVSNDRQHTNVDSLVLDNTLVPIKPNSSYTITFKTQGYDVGGNGAYYYLKLKDETQERSIGEWYSRPDEPATTMTYTFNTFDSQGQYLAFGMVNTGAYLVDDINLVRNFDGSLIKGANVEDVNNTIPVIEEKLESGYVEHFEDCVLADCTFTYGFNRWGHLTTQENEVIEGNVSFSSELIEASYTSNSTNNWFEFMYSNNKYIKLEPNTKYTVKFKYKLMSKIMQNVDKTLPGYAYIFVRSKTKGDSGSTTFAGNVEIEKVYDYVYTFTTGEARDYYIGFGIYGIGHMIIDDISVTKKG